MSRSMLRNAALAAIATGAVAVVPAHAQFGGGGADWYTAGQNAQRTSSVKTDKFISKDTLNKGDFQMQWKIKTEDAAKGASPILGGTSSGGGLSKPVNVIYSGSNTITTVDNDTGVGGWTRHFDAPVAKATALCPAGMTSVGGRSVPLVPPAGSVVRAAGAAPAGYKSVLGEPGEGLPLSVTTRAARAPVSAEFGGVNLGAPGAPGGPGAPAPGAAAGANGGLRPAPAPGAPGAGGGGGGNRGGAATPVTYKSYFQGGRYGSNTGFFLLTSDGKLRTIADGNGVELKEPVQFLPANAHTSALTVLAENNAAWHAYVVYTSTMNDCGGVPNRVWALNLADDSKPETHFDTGASPVGDLAFSDKGTIFVALGKGPASATYANAVVALEPKTLKPMAWFSDPAADFVSTPMVLKVGTKEVIAEVTRDGRIYLLDAAMPGGSDHKTALYVSPAYSTGKGATVNTALAGWVDGAASYIATPFAGAAPAGIQTSGKVTNGGILTLKVTEEGGKMGLLPVWVSADMAAPPVPVVVNGVMFAASSGMAKEPAMLYALDASNGKQLWSSGKSITSTIAGTPLWSQGSEVFVGTNDGTVYAFGPSQERYTFVAK